MLNAADMKQLFGHSLYLLAHTISHSEYNCTSNLKDFLSVKEIKSTADLQKKLVYQEVAYYALHLSECHCMLTARFLCLDSQSFVFAGEDHVTYNCCSVV